MGDPQIWAVVGRRDIHQAAPGEADRLISVGAIGPFAFLPFPRIGDDLLCNFPWGELDVIRSGFLRSLGVILRNLLDARLDRQDCGESREP